MANSEDLIREMHGDIKALRAQMESAEKAREHIRDEIVEIKGQVGAHNKELEGHRQEVTKVKTWFNAVATVLSLIWAGVLVIANWLKE